MEEQNVNEKSLAFEMRGGKLRVLLEDVVPTVKCSGETFYITESPSVIVGGKKFFVEEIV
jgi:hypothetical protein